MPIFSATRPDGRFSGRTSEIRWSTSRFANAQSRAAAAGLGRDALALAAGRVCHPISTSSTPRRSERGPAVPRNRRSPDPRRSTGHSRACRTRRSDGRATLVPSGRTVPDTTACARDRRTSRAGRRGPPAGSGRRRRRSVSSRKSSSMGGRYRSGSGRLDYPRLGPETRSVDGHQGQAAPPPVLRRAGCRTREVPVRRCRGRRSLGLLRRRVPAHDRQGDPRHLAPAVRRRASRRRGVHRPRHAAAGVGGGHDRRHRRRPAARQGPRGRPARGAAPGRRAVARDGARAHVRVRVRVLPARARPRGRVAARRAAVAPRVRHGHVGRPDGHDRRDGPGGPAVRVPIEGGRASSTPPRTRSTSGTRR